MARCNTALHCVQRVIWVQAESCIMLLLYIASHTEGSPQTSSIVAITKGLWYISTWRGMHCPLSCCKWRFIIIYMNAGDHGNHLLCHTYHYGCLCKYVNMSMFAFSWMKTPTSIHIAVTTHTILWLCIGLNNIYLMHSANNYYKYIKALR